MAGRRNAYLPPVLVMLLFVVSVAASPSLAAGGMNQSGSSPQTGLVAPTLNVSPLNIDSGQAAILSIRSWFAGGTPPYTCQWLQDPPTGGPYSYLGTPFTCAVDSLSPKSTGKLKVVGQWDFALQVTDSLLNSISSPPVSLNVKTGLNDSALVTPSVIDPGLSSTTHATATWIGGIGPFSATLYSGTNSTDCTQDTTPVATTSPNPITGITGRSVTFSYPTPTSTLDYCADITDSSQGTPQALTVAGPSQSVYPGMGSPTISAFYLAVDSGQSDPITVTWSSGIAPYKVSMYASRTSSCSTSSTLVQTVTGVMTGTYDFTTLPSITSDTWYCAKVSDSSAVTQTGLTPAEEVGVNPAMVPPVITVASQTLVNSHQTTLTVTKGFSGGTGPYKCQWLELLPGKSSYNVLGRKFSCSQSSEPSTLTGRLLALGTWNFELRVTDSGNPPSQTVSSPVSVKVMIVPTQVACSLSEVTVGRTVSCLASVYSSVPGNRPTGTVAWSAIGDGTFSSDSCSLSDQHCGVRFTPTSPAFQVTIIADYSGDSHNAPSTGNTTFSVSFSASKTSVFCPETQLLSGDNTTCSITVVGYNPTGKVNLTVVEGNGSVTFNHTTCTLVKGTCNIVVIGSTAGTVDLAATYPGDSNNRASVSAKVKLTILSAG